MALFPDESRSTKFGVKLMLGIVIWCLSVIIYKFVVHILFG